MTESRSPPRLPRSPSRRRSLLAGVSVTLVTAVVAGAFLLTREDSQATAVPPSPPAPSSGSRAPSTTRTDVRLEVIARLREILRIRHQAFVDRDPGLLETIYTSDCPCLEGDRNAIEELLSKKYKLVGGSTSIAVRHTQRITDRLWFVTATFSSARARVETESGQLVREEPPGQDLTQFMLAKPAGSTDWLLGRATPYRSG